MALTVLIAEDEAIVRLDLKEMLEEEGYQVVAETGRGDEVVDLARRHHPDLVMLDIKMPGLDGLEVAQRLSSHRASAVMLLTAFSQRELVERARDAGAFSYLVKPFHKEELVAAIEVALGRFREIRSLEQSNRALLERLEARKLIDRAKGILMDRRGMTEAEAFAHIQHSAMQRRSTMGQVAQELIDGSPPP